MGPTSKAAAPSTLPTSAQNQRSQASSGTRQVKKNATATASRRAESPPRSGPSRRLHVKAGQGPANRIREVHPPPKSSLEVAWSYSRSQAHHIQGAGPSSPSFTERFWSGPQAQAQYETEDTDGGDYETEDYSEEFDDGDEDTFFEERPPAGAHLQREAPHSSKSTAQEDYTPPQHRSRDVRRLAEDAAEDDNCRARSRSPKRIGTGGSRPSSRTTREWGRWPDETGDEGRLVTSGLEYRSAARQRVGSHHERYSLRSSSRDYSEDEEELEARQRGESQPSRRPRMRRHSSSYGDEVRASSRRPSIVGDERSPLIRQASHARSQSSPPVKQSKNYGTAALGEEREDGLSRSLAAKISTSAHPSTEDAVARRPWSQRISEVVLGFCCVGRRTR